ncbi:NADH-quinone oxidoreductase subunit L [Chloroflexota bacterium]
MESNVLAWIAIAIPIIGSILVFPMGMVSSKVRQIYSITLATITAGFTLSLIPRITDGDIGSVLWIPATNISVGLSLDSLSVFVAVVAGCIGALVVLYSSRYMESDTDEYSLSRYYFLVLLFIGGMIGLALTSNIMIMYVFWEIIGFCSYALIAYYYRQPEAVPAGTKAFIVTRIGDIGLLAGIIILWRTTGTLNIYEIMDASAAGIIPVFLLGMAGAGFIAGAAGKSAQLPLHTWLPDAMAAPTTISALIHAATLVNAGVYLLARSYPIFSGLDWWQPAILWIGSLTALMAATLALIEPDIKRVLAYSTISQLGFMVAAIGAGAVLASQFHLVSHGIFKALLFLCAGAIIHATGTKNMYEMGGLRKDMKLTNACFIIGTLSLVGIPVFSGFWSKDLILESILHEGMLAPFAILTIATLLTAAYSFRMYWMTFQGSKRTKIHGHDGPWPMSLPLVILAIGATIFWVTIGPYTTTMVNSLPLYSVEHISIGTLVSTTFGSPVIWVTVGVIILLVLLWLRWRATVADTFKEASSYTLPLRKGYWFDSVYYSFVNNGILGSSQVLRKLQTGSLNYNILGIVIGLGVFLALLFTWGLM